MKKKLGGYRPVPDWWKRLLREWLDAERGRSADLARRVPCSKGMLTQLTVLSTEDPPGPETSRIAARVAALTGIPLDKDPVADAVAELTAEGQLLHDLNPKELEHAIAFVRDLRRSVQKFSTLQKSGDIGTTIDRGEAHGRRKGR